MQFRTYAVPALSLLLLTAFPAAAQKGSSVPAPSASAGASAGTGSLGSGGTRGTYNNIPNANTRTDNSQGVNQQPIFFSGRVLFDDGTPPNTNVRIERVCGADTRLESHVDSKGRFSFQLGQNIGTDTDASSSSFGSFPGQNPNGSAGGFGNGNSTFGNSRGGSDSLARSLWNCELRASYPGYSSDTVRLAGRQPLDQPDIGTIVLHHLGAAQGTTISLTSSLAPKNAQKAYQKGMQLMEKGRFEEAQQRLREATEVYPKYAIAWYALGQLQQRQGQSADARKSYEASVAADNHYVNPYDQLARLAAQQGNWEDAAKFSKQAISLNPVEFPSSLWYHAIASYQLKNNNDAEKSVTDLLKLDTRHYYPQAENLMGQLLLDKGNYPDAATHFNSYLKLVPNASNADAIKQVLTRLQGENALTKAAPASPQP